MGDRTVVIAAGGTGGHLFVAESLACELVKRGFKIELLTDDRAEGYTENFPGKITIINSATINIKKPMTAIFGFISMFKGIWQSIKVLKAVKACSIVGFGGYPSLPPVIASFILRIPVITHEQNSIMGRANKIAAKISKVIGIAFSKPIGLDKKYLSKTRFVGNPVREAVHLASEIPYKKFTKGNTLNLLIFGGSQGASIFFETMPKVFALLEDDIKENLAVVQQCRLEELEVLTDKYKEIGLDVELNSFFTNLPELIAKSHLIICRSGALSVSEIVTIGRPAIFVPLPNSLDNDQLYNALDVMENYDGWIIEQKHLTPQKLASLLTGIYNDSSALDRVVASFKDNNVQAIVDNNRDGEKIRAEKKLADIVEEFSLYSSINKKKTVQNDIESKGTEQNANYHIIEDNKAVNNTNISGAGVKENEII